MTRAVTVTASVLRRGLDAVGVSALVGVVSAAGLAWLAMVYGRACVGPVGCRSLCALHALDPR
jgi:ABC-type methionine transport system permease subunit